jgi:intracellular sulfur oxidation DsrE/DsrF family protein
MKKFVLACIAFVVCFATFGQTKPVKIVFDITSKDTLTHQAVMRHVTGMAKSYPDSKFEVIIYGGAISMVTLAKSSVSESIQQLGPNPNVAFKVCGETMKRYQLTKEQLVPGVLVVPDAILEIVMRQGEGWGYIKEAHN